MVLLEKGDTVRSGAGGPGCDHWCNVPANPHSRVDPDEWAEHMADAPYSCGIGLQIQCREDWDTLLEMEQMGGKIRDTDDEYVGAEGSMASNIIFGLSLARVSPASIPRKRDQMWLSGSGDRPLNPL